jgi:hypothetical protein
LEECFSDYNRETAKLTPVCLKVIKAFKSSNCGLISPKKMESLTENFEEAIKGKFKTLRTTTEKLIEKAEKDLSTQKQSKQQL